MRPFAESQQPLVVSHRGVRRPGVRENTPAALAAAAAAGADWVELDVRRSADGVAVVAHDAHTRDGVPIVMRDAAALADVGVSRLVEALAVLPARVGVDVEVKNLPGEPDFDESNAVAHIVAATVRPHVGSRPLAMTSFNPLTVAALAAALPELPAGLVHSRSLRVTAALAIAAEHGAQLLCPEVGSLGLDPGTVGAVHDAGMALLVWTVNDAEQALALAAAGVDALCTDDPAALRGWLTPARRPT